MLLKLRTNIKMTAWQLNKRVNFCKNFQLVGIKPFVVWREAVNMAEILNQTSHSHKNASVYLGFGQVQ